MQIIRHVITPILVAVIFLSGMPYFPCEDANHDNRTDLQDAILLVKEFAQTAEQPDMFAAKVEKMISALHVLAGLKTVIKQDKTSASNSFHLDHPYLASSYQFAIYLSHFSEIAEKPLLYQSAMLVCDVPPS